MNSFCFLSIVWISLILKPIASGKENAAKYSFNPVNYTCENNQAKRKIPVLCYHNIKPLKKGTLPDYTIDEAKFYEHMKMLHDSGYTAILPDQLHEYLTMEKTLPSKPVMITFDDSHEDHFSKAGPILESFGYRGVFFIMAVTISKPSYLTSAQIKELSERGHVIAGHTWDHPNLKMLQEKEWDEQISQPKMQLEKITGRPVEYFAYPYGAWNDSVIIELKKLGIKAAFQLSEKQSEREPLYTIRRLMVAGNWTATSLHKLMEVFCK